MLLLTSDVVADPDGGVSGIRTGVVDISDRQRYEQELLRERRRAQASEARERTLSSGHLDLALTQTLWLALATLREKLGEDTAPYTILGACNPPLAHQALEADAAIGGLLPSNVVVRAHPAGGAELIAIDPERMLALANEPALRPLAREVSERLQRALEATN